MVETDQTISLDALKNGDREAFALAGAAEARSARLIGRITQAFGSRPSLWTTANYTSEWNPPSPVDNRVPGSKRSCNQVPNARVIIRFCRVILRFFPASNLYY